MPNLNDIEKYFDRYEDGYGLLSDDIEWLIRQVRQGAVKVIKKRGERATVIEYNGERYVYQSDSTARGGVSSGKR